MQVAVTGATGLLGANVVRALLDAGRDVRVGVRDRSDTRAIDGLAIERVAFDVTDRDALIRAFTGCDAVIHAAAAVSAGRTGRDMLERVNVGGTRAVCEAVVAAGVNRLVHVSSASVIGLRDDGVPSDETCPYNSGWIGDPYADTKAAADEVVRGFTGFDAVTVFPGYMFGPWDTRPSSGQMILAVARGTALIASPGVNDFVDVRDVARGIVAALDRGAPGRGYILGGVGMTYAEVWRRIAAIVGARPPLLVAPRPLVRWIGAMGGAMTAITGREPVLNPVSATYGTLPNYAFSSARARAELGYGDTDVDRAIADAWAWFRQFGYA